MLIDDFRLRVSKKGTELFWLGGDPELRKMAEKENSDYIGEKFLEFLDTCMPFDCIGIQPLLEAASGDKGFRFIRDCEQGLPPYPATAFEVKRAGLRFLLIMERDVVNYPVDVWAFYARENALKRPGVETARVIPVEQIRGKGKVRIEGAAHVVSVSLLLDNKDQWYFMDSFVAYFTDKAGKILTAPLLREQLQEFFGDPDIVQKLAGIGAQGLSMVGLVLNLLACKNIEATDNIIPEGLQKARLRRGKDPLTVYKTLKIIVPKGLRPQKSLDERKAEAAGELQALLKRHTVAGHVADYRERGLFGKYKGKFWIPEHARGSLEAGEVKKTYQLTKGKG